MGGKAILDDLLETGKAKLEGNRKPFDQFRSALVQFDPVFELLPGTKPSKPVTAPAKEPFEQPEPPSSAGG